MKKELQLFSVDGKPGYNQEWFRDWWMNKGGCGAVTACDCCLYFAKRFGLSYLYDGDVNNITKADYERFAMIMKPFLSPRYTGINKLEIFVDGYKDYLNKVKDDKIKMSFLYANCSYSEFSSEVKRLLNNDMPVPVLVLKHKSPNMAPFVWHWFWLAGYETFEGTVMVKIITYASYFWVPLYELWDSGYKQKGGIVRFELDSEGGAR